MSDFFLDKISEPRHCGQELVSFNGLFHSNCHDSSSNNDCTYQNITFFERAPKKMFLVLNHPSKVYFQGSLLVECIKGVVEIHGFTLKDDHISPLHVISGYGQSAICISTIEGFNSTTGRYQNKSLNNKLYDLIGIEKPKQSCDTIMLLLSKVEEDAYNLLDMDNLMSPQISSHNGNYSYFHKAEEWLDCTFDLSSGNRIQPKMTYHPQLISLSEAILDMEDPIVTICGGKGVGKSTALQYLVNRMFDRWENILVIDFDIGQPEFTIPGCVSVVLVENPLMGPSFTRLLKPLRSIIIGHVDPEMCLTKFLSAIDDLSKFCHELKNRFHIPWFINTMGYIKGFGLPLIAKIISTFHPTHVVQINSAVEPNLNVFPLTPQNFRSTFESHPFDIQPLTNYEFILFPAPIIKNTMFISPKVLRMLKLYAYLYAKGRQDLYIRRVRLRKLSGENGVLKINNVVAITPSWTSEAENVVAHITSFGVVAHIHKDEVYVLTPMSEGVAASQMYISIMELGLQDLMWEKLFQGFQKPITREIIVKLGNKLNFSSGFLF